MDGSSGVTFSTTATNDIQGWLEASRPTLVARCDEHKTAVYVVTGTAAQPELGEYNTYTVRLRFDEGTPSTEGWNQSTDSKALFASHPIGIARHLARTRTLLFQFTPFNASPAIARFDVRGFGPHLAELARTCNWQ